MTVRPGSITSARVRRFSGTPREVGLAAGKALGTRLEENIARYLRERPQQAGALDLAALRRGAVPWLRTLPSRFQEEYEGLAEGAGASLQRVAEWAYVETCIDDGCSGFVGSLDGHAWVARNNDMFVPGMWGYVTIREVAGRIATLSFGLEGDVFTATGVNRDRLWLHHQALPTSGRPRPGRQHQPGWVLLTDMLETCSTIDEVGTRLAEVDRDDAMLLFVVDGKSDESAIFECACSGHTRRRSTGRWMAATNHVRSGGPASEDSRSRLARMETMVAGLYEREPGVSLPADLIAILADAGVERRGHDLSTVYANVACPASGNVWFTFGGYPAASRGAWRRIPWPW